MAFFKGRARVGFSSSGGLLIHTSSSWRQQRVASAPAGWISPAGGLVGLGLLLANGLGCSTVALMGRHKLDAMERLMRLGWGTTTSCQTICILPLCSISAAVSAWYERTSQTGWNLNSPSHQATTQATPCPSPTPPRPRSNATQTTTQPAKTSGGCCSSTGLRYLPV